MVAEPKPRGLWLDTPTETILEANCIRGLREIPYLSGKHADLIVTSPPYNLSEYGKRVSYDVISDSMPVNQYFNEFSYQWLNEAWKIAKPNGRLCLNVPVDVAKPYPMPFASYITTVAETAGWKFRYHIWWYDGHKGRNTAWGSYNSPTQPYVFAGMELILVFFKETWPVKKNGRISDMLPYEFGDYVSGFWTFPGESRKKRNHPAPFPEELVKRCIKLFTFPGADTLVVDPFNGSGTTTAVAKHLWRSTAGIEISPAYCALAAQRTKTTERATNREAYRRFREDGLWPV